MRLERIGTALAVAGGLMLVIAVAARSSSVGVGAIALASLGIAMTALSGPVPLGGRLVRTGLAIASLGLATFAMVAILIDGVHPTVDTLQVALLLGVLLGIAATAIGAIILIVASVRTIRAHHASRGVAALLGSLVLLGLAGYTTYVGALGSDELAHPVGNTDCRTPMTRFGWTYEAINYDITADASLAQSNPDLTKCASQGMRAGHAVVTSDGIPIAGWYIPAADGVGPTGPTIVVVHGWGANKSEVLKYAVPFHPRFNVVAFDERDGGRSGVTDSTFGMREQLDVEAVINWLERTKHPVHLAVMGNSMGGGASTLAAADDPRIEALILDSTHAHVSSVLETRLEVDAGGHPGIPGTPAIMAGFWLRTGVDLMQADPISKIPALGRRPLLLIHGAADVNDVPALSVELMDQQAVTSGVPVEMHLCPGATHGLVIDTCPTAWGVWAVAFLDRVFDLPT